MRLSKNIFWGLALGFMAVHAAEKSAIAPFDFGKDPMRYISNSRLRLGVDLSIGGAVTLLEDKQNGNTNMINSHDWGRQIQMSYYSGPVPYIGPKGEQPHKTWAKLGWNPIQSGSVGNIKSKTIFFEQPNAKTLRVRCIPMQWPHIHVEGDCIFEATYTIVSENAVEMKARIINQRTDKTQYKGRHQEMPALYTNGSWYRLMTYTGDAPFTGGPLTTLVDKGDNKGWPWIGFNATERWAALVNDQGTGVGLFQPEVLNFIGGFAGGDKQKGFGGVKDGQTGYIAPVGSHILDHNIDWTYRTYLIVGNLEEIRAFAFKKNGAPQPPAWLFDQDRHGFIYHGSASDSGWPIQNGLHISYSSKARGVVVAPATFWKAADLPELIIDAAFSSAASTNTPQELTVGLTPYSGKALTYSIPVRLDGTRYAYRLPLHSKPEYKGAMKQLTLYLPQTDGTVKLFSITPPRKE